MMGVVSGRCFIMLLGQALSLALDLLPTLFCSAQH